MNAKFYIMPDSVHADSEALYHHACELIASHYQQGARIYVLAPDQAAAERIDEQLWQFEASQFVPHNLSGEGPRGGAPVEIGWQAPTQRRQILVNLCPEAPEFARQYQLTIDFVPADDDGKAAARERYRVYRQHGLNLETEAYTKHQSN
ncbi:DNA polymerase III subunit chi [Aliagarivorans taiwanensis]|uniref:DNA polymerase III subunit chi n=1 Tax=Aliagarivorans taiwanensis TaxID=561966 RepID=UPI00047E5964|nr:DNA polymerase III subunit chi [Aliagarivorans taiwanensis]